MKRILGVDYGDVRTGLAVSDPSGTLAGGIGVVRANGMRAAAAHIAEAAAKYDVGEIVLGYPVNMNGTEGPRAEKAKQLAQLLRELCEAEVVLFDERLTTSAAHRILNETDTRGKKRRGVIDTLSAEIILQDYIDGKKARNS